MVEQKKKKRYGVPFLFLISNTKRRHHCGASILFVCISLTDFSRVYVIKLVNRPIYVHYSVKHCDLIPSAEGKNKPNTSMGTNKNIHRMTSAS